MNEPSGTTTMTGERPDPDALLERVRGEEIRSRRGRLKIFFGASAGVGKTYAMLVAALAAQAQGTVLTIGLVETHGRSETEAMAAPLPRLPLREIAYRDRVLREFDLDAALAFAAPHPHPLVLVDELAHSNTPGSRHPKRWQDVEELLAAGVDVWTTMNVQHLESLNDIVGGITGIRVRETVPDRIFDEADEVVVVDLPPDELLARLKAGKVYLPQQAERAAANFFRKGNLLALRELALRRTADRVDDQMQAWRRTSGGAAAAVWPNREALLACVGPGDNGDKVVRSCARLAAQAEVAWHAVHVETPAIQRMSDASRQRVLATLELARTLGATTASLAAPDAADALIRYARQHNLARVMMGRRRRTRWPWERSVFDRVAGDADDLDVMQVALSPTPGASPRPPAPAASSKDGWRGYAAALVVCAATTLVATPLIGVFALVNIVMLFLLAVVVIALGYGRGPAALAAVVGVGLFDFFFVPPRFSFAVSDVEYLVTFLVMLIVGLVVGQLTAGAKLQAEAAVERERRVRSLYEMSRDLGAALLPEQVAEIAARFVAVEFGAASALLAAEPDQPLRLLPGPTATVDMAVAQWAFDRGEPAGRGTDTLPSSRCLMLPLNAPMRRRGVLALEPRDDRPLGPEHRQLLETCASLLAISLERIHYIDVAQSSTLQMESERLRNSLLSAISHDLRTPLASLVGLADTLALSRPAPVGQQAEITAAIRASAMRMSSLVNNLLDMARLESGAVRLNRQWQPIEEVVGSALAACAPMLEHRPIDVRLDDGLPLLLLDAVLVERVLVNLLENIAKYTPAGSPVAITAGVEGEAVVLTVDDRGPGLPRDREEAIFQKFERGSRESAMPGVGLGLAISRAIVEAHGGTIRGETRTDGGARFTIRWPRGEPPGDDGGATAGVDDGKTPVTDAREATGRAVERTAR